MEIAERLSRRRFGSRRWVEHFVLIALVVGFAIKGFIPAWQHLNSDFPNYYLVARLYRAGYPLDRVYEWTWLQRQKDLLGIDQGLVSFIPSTLPSALAVAPWCSLPPLQAKRWWLLMNLVFLLLTTALLTRVTRLGWERIAVLIFLAFIPLRNNFLLGQMHVFVLLLLTFSAFLYFRKASFLAGVSLAIAAAMKIYPALFLIFFVCKKQWRAAMGLVVGLSSATAISFYAFGKDACLLYAREVLPAGLRGETIDPYNTAWNSLTALLRRLFIAEPELNPTPVAHIPWLYALLQPLVHSFIFVVFMWVISSNRRDCDKAKVEWATYLFLLLFLSSQPSSYHFVALVLTAVLVTDNLIGHKQNLLAGCTVLLYALICGPLVKVPWRSPTGWYNLLFFSRLGLMALFGGVLLWIFVPASVASLRAHLDVRSLVAAACAMAVLVVVGFISTQRHLTGQFENYKARVATMPGDLLATSPAVTSSGILFTYMTRDGYTIRRVQGGSTLDFPRTGGDWFHPTVPGLSDSGWAERSSSDGSRVDHFLTGGPRNDVAAVTVSAENAEEPVVSWDGHLLAFLRSVNGRNSLWVQTVSAAIGNAGAVEAREIAGEEYNVREVTFAPDHRLIFSSKRTGRFALYIATQSGDVQELRRPICSARYPAMSSDGRWMAFSCEEGGSWHIYIMDFQGNKEVQLSRGDCNSISPAWTTDSKHLIYATDCGRGLGLTALAEMAVFH